VGRAAVVSLLEKSEAECREWARENFDADSAVDDTGDDVEPDTAVFYPEIQSWEPGSDGDLCWRDVTKEFFSL
jgi:Ser-tRNA(Ala) deacylase AlaX